MDLKISKTEKRLIENLLKINENMFSKLFKSVNEVEHLSNSKLNELKELFVKSFQEHFGIEPMLYSTANSRGRSICCFDPQPEKKYKIEELKEIIIYLGKMYKDVMLANVPHIHLLRGEDAFGVFQEFNIKLNLKNGFNIIEIIENMTKLTNVFASDFLNDKEFIKTLINREFNYWLKKETTEMKDTKVVNSINLYIKNKSEKIACLEKLLIKVEQKLDNNEKLEVIRAKKKGFFRKMFS